MDNGFVIVLTWTKTNKDISLGQTPAIRFVDEVVQMKRILSDIVSTDKRPIQFYGQCVAAISRIA